MDFWQQYRAIDARDVRFDGQFVTAVSTTGIYCRPSCPARTPRPAHVRFYPTSAAAHEAGYRACKRCLPEAVPGNPRWNLRSDVSARAMRLIAEGEVDRTGVPGLAARLGYSTRQLNRVLREELGAGALALARAQRAQTARTLLTGSDLSTADVAFAAGFGSIRQFNDTLRQIFDLTPRQLRQSAGRAPAPTSAAGEPVTLTLTLPARLPYDDGIFRFLADRAVDGMELGSGSSYERILPLPGGPAWFRALAVEPRGNGGAALPVTVSVADLGDLPLLLGRIRRLFDLDADPVAVDAALAEDERLGALSAAVPGIRLPGTPDPYELLVRALVEERRPRGAARAALSRLVRTGPSVDLPGTPLRRMFPTAEQLVEALPHHGAGIEPAGVLRAVAHDLLSGALDPGIGAGTTAVRAQLVAHPGISPWVAHQVLLRGLGDPDVHVTDAGTRAGWVRSGGRGGSAGDTASSDAVHLAMTAARPWRSYATVHLWRAAEGLSPGAAPPTGTAAERIRHTT